MATIPPRRAPLFRALSRRDFLAAMSTTALAWPFRQLPVIEAADREVNLKDYPFPLGVASGDPAPDGVVLWTRLTVDPLTPGGGMPQEDVQVDWEVCSDEGMTRPVQSGSVTAHADWAHSVHVEVEGLEPDRVYWYRFRTGGEISPVGRTRTTPASGTLMDRLRFAFASCQHYEQGYFTAYDHMSQEDLHAVIHLGDYIYEYGPDPRRPRLHNSPEIQTIDDYRARHALYRSDEHLQAAHAAFPWILTWDDHEFDNNYANEVSEQDGIDPVEFMKRRAAAYKAYYEHMPLRRTCVPRGPMMELYRNVDYGGLVRFNVLDTRQYRSDQPCNDRSGTPCDGVFAPDATLLGEQQERWLQQRLKESPTRWNVLAQQIMMARVDRRPGDGVAYSMDQWSGYDGARNRLLQFLADNNISNPVVLTGDIHTNWANNLHVDFDRADQSPVVATEFVGTSISSGGDGSETRRDTDSVYAENPFVKFYNAERGYVSCEVTPDEWKSDYKVVEYVTRPGAPCLTRASFRVEAGRPGIEHI